MNTLRMSIAIGMAVAAGLLAGSAAQAMSRQAPPRNADGSSKLADPDEAVERMAGGRQAGDGQGRFRDFSDSAVEARDAVRSPFAAERSFPPFQWRQ